MLKAFVAHLFLMSLATQSAIATPRTVPYPMGTPLTAQDLRAYQTTIYPDGRNLPKGSGTSLAGQKIYAQQCAACHGETGQQGPAARLVGSDGFWSWRDPLRPIRILRYPILVNSVGAQWPYATTIFDYVRRAMPHFNPKSLTDDEVYALTAYLLYLNRLIDEKQVIDARTLPHIVMPGLGRTQGEVPQHHQPRSPTPQ